MKTKTVLLSALFTMLVFCSCSYHYHQAGALPPGQAKKVTGSKSAKPYAPGQQKKH
jgi:hypothetical protein